MKFFLLKLWNIWTRTNYFFNYKNYKFLSKKKIKILFLKPETYLDLYTINGKKFKSLVLSSFFRLGPVGLFYNLSTDFVIFKENIKGKILKNLKKNLLKKKKIKQFLFQKKISQNLEKINFNKYDLIIVFDKKIPNKYIYSNQKALWSIMYEDHKNKSYKKSIFAPEKPYDLILNQTQGFTPYSFFRKKHWIDFPYTFGNADFVKHFNIKKKFCYDLVIEVNQRDEVKDYLSKLPYKIYFLDQKLNMNDYINVLCNSKIFFSGTPKTPRWGNSLIESSLCGMLIVGDAFSYWNSLSINSSLHVSNLNELDIILKKLLSDVSFYKKQLLIQKKRINQINFIRPLNQILEFAKSKNRHLNIKRKLTNV